MNKQTENWSGRANQMPNHKTSNPSLNCALTITHLSQSIRWHNRSLEAAHSFVRNVSLEICLSPVIIDCQPPICISLTPYKPSPLPSTSHQPFTIIIYYLGLEVYVWSWSWSTDAWCNDAWCMYDAYIFWPPECAYDARVDGEGDFIAEMSK